jgi:hypothetical protein
VRLSRANAEVLFALVQSRGIHDTRLVVSNAPLIASRLPDPAAMAKTGDLGVAPLSPRQNLAARTSEPDRHAEERERANASREQTDFRDVMITREPKARRGHGEVRRSASRVDEAPAGSDREARLRAVYRKYGFTW